MAICIGILLPIAGTIPRFNQLLDPRIFKLV
jgi:hypothetical protein